MRLPYALLAIASLTALVLIACGGGGDGDEPDATSTLPAPTATTTTAPLVDVPGRPNAFADYPGVVGIYLTTAGPAALGAPCLSDLIDEWAMIEPGVPVAPEERCLVGNTDGDADQEVIVLFTVEADDGIRMFSNVVVFDSTPDGYVVVYESFTPDQFEESSPQRIVAAEDLTGHGRGELVYTATTCGANTCWLRVNVVTGGTDDGTYSDLTPEDGILMEYADLTVEDLNGDGEQEIVLHGGVAGGNASGPQRTRTDVYGWIVGATLGLQETTFDSSDVLYFHIIDADAFFNEGNFAIAAQRYRDAIANQALVETGYHENELDELGAYAVFRIAASQVIEGDTEAAALALEQGLVDYAGTVNAGLIEAFQQGYADSDNYQGGCLAVLEHINANLDDFQAFWAYGTSNPSFDPERVCPFSLAH